MLTHGQKYEIVARGMQSWAIKEFGIIGYDFIPEEEMVEEQIKEFDEDPEFWQKVEDLLEEVLSEEERNEEWRRL